MHEHHVVQRKLSLGKYIVERQRQNAAVGEADAPGLASPARWPLHNHCWRLMYVIEGQPGIQERELPRRSRLLGGPPRLDARDSLRQVRLRTMKLHPAGTALVAPQPFLQ